MLNTKEEGKVEEGKKQRRICFYTSETLMVTGVNCRKVQNSHCYQEGEFESLWVLFIHVKAAKPPSKGVVSRFPSQVRRILEHWVPRTCRRTQTKDLVTEWTV
jgi:hypothetical protein